ncbi:hypothetical protein [Rubellicoccus peritrichatus]|uniref:Uncharacterized protein n=1 Tax=Rubellicoccus peritrichatus TaxID=3080537 RepID=A0AAQ3QTN7_9BACT|nr:hypothetical protein [Puniceicoccus sp. CR14]WOO39588.1 hypothetical protein RZN69_13270 [Puniceicoccus sp. CR14]
MSPKNADTMASSSAKKAYQSSEKENWPPGMKIVNGHLAHSIREQGMIQEPNRYGYIHLAGEFERPSPIRSNSAEKRKLLDELKTAATRLQSGENDVNRADVFDAFIIPPGSKEGRKVLNEGNYKVHVAEFDVVVLVECISPEAAMEVRGSKLFLQLKGILEKATKIVHCITAKNAKRIAEVDHDRNGVFLFNYFFAADVESEGAEGIEILLGVWEYTAGWWTAKANLTNSTPIQPLKGEKSSYSLINHCRWDRLIDVLPSLLFKPSLHKFVLKNFTANDIIAMPILYRLA